MRKNFINPPKEYGSAPLWVWHTKITERIIDSMMYEFKQNAFGGVFVHPRPGLVTEYLSKEWFDLFAYTVKKGKELDMNVWIYDENSYPTGFAGGLIQDQMPESYNQGQMLHLTKTVLLPTVLDDVFACFKIDNNNITDITGSMNAYRGKAGNYYIITKQFYTANRGILNGPVGFSYVDLLAKGVTEKFIDITFEGYKKAIGTEFGKTVAGTFSDEPSIPTEGADNIRWTPDLFDTFKQQWGYDLREHLPSLFTEIGDWKRVRHNYQQTLLDLFINRWSKPMHDYTEKNGLKWTGHYWEHGWPDPQHVPDNMAMYAWHQYPGIDMLFNQFDEKSPNAQFGNIRAVKELASVANQLNKERTLSETYGGGGWDVTFKDLKRLADWEFALGVNFLNQHLSFMTLTGARKYDYPPSFSYHNSWWPYYKYLNQYYARLSLALSSGKQKNLILIIEPTTSAWMYVAPGNKNKRFDEIGKGFQDFVTFLEKSQVEYDLGSENIIKDTGRVLGNKFIVGQRAYTTVVLPPGMDNINEPTYKLLKEYINNGGKVIQFEKLKTIDGTSKSDIDKLGGTKNNIIRLDEINKAVIDTHFRSRDLQVSLQGGNTFHHRRIMDDGQLIFFSNASMDTATTGSLIVRGTGILLMDLFTGNIFDYPEKKLSGGFVKADITIPPAGSKLLFVANGKQPGFEKYISEEKVIAVETGVTKIARPAENTLNIDFCDIRINGTGSILKDVYVPKASNIIFRHYGFSEGAGNPWFNQTQFKNYVVARDTFSKGTGFTASYRFIIEPGVEYKKFRAVVEQGNLWNKVEINGQPISLNKNAWWLDRAFNIFDIGNYLHPGENILSLSITPMSIFAEVEPVYILGDFNLNPAKKGWAISPPQPLEFGSWDKQGLPMYAHGIRYIKELDIHSRNKQYAIQLGEWKGSVVAVRVNNVDVGIIMPGKDQLKITQFLREGKNNIEVQVIGSMKNLLGPFHNSPPAGLAGPGSWNTDRYPPGEEYGVLPYGLMNDFSIVEIGN